MTHSIKNAFMTVTVSEKGAELQSILGADGTEYLWQGDPAYWNDRALNIFPYVARLNEGKYYLDGALHHMDIHGIAPYLGLWHWPKTDAPYVCIEPWCSLPASENTITVFENQTDLIKLDPSNTYKNRWTIQIR